MDITEIEKIVEDEIQNLTGKPVPGVDHEIFSTGYLDSLNILHIIMFLEQRFSIKVDLFGVNLDTFGSVGKIAQFVMEKQG